MIRLPSPTRVAFVFAILISQAINTQPADAQTSKRPNIIFIMADDKKQLTYRMAAKHRKTQHDTRIRGIPRFPTIP